MSTPAAAASPSLIDELKALLGDRLSTSAAVREQHGKDESFHEPAAPDAVAFAESTEEVAAQIVRLCAAAGLARHCLRDRNISGRPRGSPPRRDLCRRVTT